MGEIEPDAPLVLTLGCILLCFWARVVVMALFSVLELWLLGSDVTRFLQDLVRFVDANPERLERPHGVEAVFATAVARDDADAFGQDSGDRLQAFERRGDAAQPARLDLVRDVVRGRRVRRRRCDVDGGIERDVLDRDRRARRRLARGPVGVQRGGGRPRDRGVVHPGGERRGPRDRFHHRRLRRRPARADAVGRRRDGGHAQGRFLRPHRSPLPHRKYTRLSVRAMRSLKWIA